MLSTPAKPWCLAAIFPSPFSSSCCLSTGQDFLLLSTLLRLRGSDPHLREGWQYQHFLATVSEGFLSSPAKFSTFPAS